jgi:glycosyltransferase involved in cell wall biosynthesis
LVDSTIGGVTGLIAKTESPASLADELSLLSRSPERYAELRRNAWRRAFEFQWDKVLPPACAWLESKARGASGPLPGASSRA